MRQSPEERRGARQQLEPRGGAGRLPPSPPNALVGCEAPRDAQTVSGRGTGEIVLVLASELTAAVPVGCWGGGPGCPAVRGGLQLWPRGSAWVGWGVPLRDLQPGWTRGRLSLAVQRPHRSKNPFSSCLAAALHAPAQLVATGAEPWPGGQRGQGQDKPIPGAELAAAGGRRRGLSPLSFNSWPRWFHRSLGALPARAQCWGQRGGSAAAAATAKGSGCLLRLLVRPGDIVG